jgi:hypothetical protein
MNDVFQKVASTVKCMIDKDGQAVSQWMPVSPQKYKGGGVLLHLGNAN